MRLRDYLGLYLVSLTFFGPLLLAYLHTHP